MSYVQFFGSFSDVEDKYPSVQLWADGEGKVFFDEDDQRNYIEYGDYIVLEGGKHVVSKSEPKEEPKTPTNTGKSEDEETEMRPGQGSATTDDRK